MNGKLLALYYGTRSAPNQMCKYFSASKALKAKSGILFHNAPEQIINMYSDLTKLSGQPEANTILPEEEVALEIMTMTMTMTMK